MEEPLHKSLIFDEKVTKMQPPLGIDPEGITSHQKEQKSQKRSERYIWSGTFLEDSNYTISEKCEHSKTPKKEIHRYKADKYVYKKIAKKCKSAKVLVHGQTEHERRG